MTLINDRSQEQTSNRTEGLPGVAEINHLLEQAPFAGAKELLQTLSSDSADTVTIARNLCLFMGTEAQIFNATLQDRHAFGLSMRQTAGQLARLTASAGLDAGQNIQSLTAFHHIFGWLQAGKRQAPDTQQAQAEHLKHIFMQKRHRGELTQRDIGVIQTFNQSLIELAQRVASDGLDDIHPEISKLYGQNANGQQNSFAQLASHVMGLTPQTEPHS